MMSGADPLAPPAILIIEDDADVARTMQIFLERSGMRTRLVATGAEAAEAKRDFEPDVVLVDMGLPDTSGVTVVSWLARAADCGIIVVSGSGDEADRIVAIELGADDYVTKPPAMRELAARIRAVHRRVASRAVTKDGSPKARETASRPQADEGSLTIGSLRLDLRHRTAVDASGAPISLTAAEYRTLEVLIEGRGEPVSRDRLCEAALNRKLGFEDRSVDQLILGIRRKLGDDDGRRVISSVRGAGYALYA